MAMLIPSHNDRPHVIRPKEEARKTRASLLGCRPRSAARRPALPRCADKTRRANWFRPFRGPFLLEDLLDEITRLDPHEPQLPAVSHGATQTELSGLLGASKAALAQLNDRWRVVDDSSQWVLQQREGERWRDRSFCQTKRTLLRCVREYCGQANIGALQSLPDCYGGKPDTIGAPYCTVCGRWRAQPQKGLPVHLFCQAHRRKGTKGKLIELDTFIFD